MIASKISLPKLGFNCGSNAPGGSNICNASNNDNKSSGKPAGNGLILCKSKEEGLPNPGMDGPLGPVGGLIVIGSQGHILNSYISSYLVSPGRIDSLIFNNASGPKIDSISFKKLEATDSKV